MKFKEACEILGIEPINMDLAYKWERELLLDEAKEKYLSLIKQNHPDLGGDHDKSVQIIHAYKSMQRHCSENRYVTITELFAKKGELWKEKRRAREKARAAAKRANKSLSNPSSNAKRKPVYQFDLSGKLVKQWESVTAAAKGLGIFRPDISKVCQGKYRQCHNFLWSFNDTAPVYKPKKCIKFGQYDQDGNLIKVFNSKKELSDNGFNYQNVWRAEKLKWKYKEFYWKKEKQKEEQEEKL